MSTIDWRGEMTRTHHPSSLSHRLAALQPTSDVASALPKSSSISRAQGRHPTRGDQERAWRTALRALPVLLFSALVISALSIAWMKRDDDIITPQNGLGYALGIAGSVMMLLLLLYPMRKRYPALSLLGGVPAWFRVHMILGIIGPTLIILHSNFGVGSLNSTVSLIAMLLVVVSGIIGRFLYAKIHRGLYGKRNDLTFVLQNVENIRLAMAFSDRSAQGIAAELSSFEAHAVGTRGGILASLAQLALFRPRSRRSRRIVMRHAQSDIAISIKAGTCSRRDARRRLNDLRRDLRDYFNAAKAVTRFSLFEQLFALWHILHMPLFVLLVLTAIAHVIAVHLY